MTNGSVAYLRVHVHRAQPACDGPHVRRSSSNALLTARTQRIAVLVAMASRAIAAALRGTSSETAQVAGLAFQRRRVRWAGAARFDSEPSLRLPSRARAALAAPG